MLSLTELRRAAPLLEQLISGHRVQLVLQPDATSLVLTTYGGSQAGRRHVRFSCRHNAARVSQLEAPPRAAPRPPAFSQFLRSHVVGARVGAARLIEDDRQLALRLHGPQRDFELLLAILGPRSNLLLLDGDGVLLVSLRPLSETRPELAIGEPWRSPESRPPTVGIDRFEEEADDHYLLAIEAHYAELEQSDEADDLRRRLERALNKEAKALDRKLAKLDQSLEQARLASRLERDGELLKSVLSKVKRGDSVALARDFETGQEVEIALDPTLMPAENLERLFKQYRKAIRSLSKGGARHAAVTASREEIAEWIERFETLTAGDVSTVELEGFGEEPAIRRLLSKYSPAPAARGSRPGQPLEHKLAGQVVPNRLMPRRYRTAGELEIWVGRSAAGNDHLSLRLARGKDLFFHLDGAPGSHVILRTQGRSDPPSEAVLDACELAVHYSKSKNATRADVHAVPIANVRKPKGGKPGLVTVHGGKTIHLRRTESRLERILSARIED